MKMHLPSIGPLYSGLLLLGTLAVKNGSALARALFLFSKAAYGEGIQKAVYVVVLRFLNKSRRIIPKPVKLCARKTLAFAKKSNARLRLGIGIQPLSHLWGFDRGFPIHRYYLEQFLQEFRDDIRGHCLEFQNGSYAKQFGDAKVNKLDILHIDDSNPVATIVGDLTKSNDIPSNTFDCIICTHVFHVIYELDKAVSELYRILKPGGVLLTAVPQVSMCDPNWHEIWRFTPEGLALVLAKAFGKDNVIVRGYGNSLTTAAEIRGLVSTELSKSVLDYQDPRFAVEVCARAWKPFWAVACRN